MKKRVGIGCLILLVLSVVFLTIAFFKSDSLAKAIAGRTRASLSSPELLDQIPQEWVDILIQVEDPSFFDHRGVDLRTLVRVGRP